MFLVRNSYPVLLVLVLATCLLTGCLYRPELNQGDYLTQAELDKLEPGMTKNEVQQVMGTPALIPVFELDEWNYTFASLPGNQRNKTLKFKTISLYFKHDRLQSYRSTSWHPVNLPKYQGP
jgi:outer membrane protein assembly factor BamE